MLSIVQPVALAQLARRQQVGIAAARNRPRLQAQHGAHAARPPRSGCRGLGHEPVDAAELMGAAMNRCELLQVLHEQVAVQHQGPRRRLDVMPACSSAGAGCWWSWAAAARLCGQQRGREEPLEGNKR
jgi:hypothetical protein